MPGERPGHMAKQTGSSGKKNGKGKKRESLAHLAKINSEYHNHSFKEELGKSFKDKQHLEHGEYTQNGGGNDRTMK